MNNDNWMEDQGLPVWLCVVSRIGSGNGRLTINLRHPANSLVGRREIKRKVVAQINGQNGKWVWADEKLYALCPST